VLVIDLNTIPLTLIQPVLERSLVAHNAKFEYKHLLHAGLTPKKIHCTQLMARVVTGESQLSLAKCIKQVFGWEVDKHLQVSEWSAKELSREQIEYAALDAVLAFKLAEKYRLEIERSGQGRSYQLMIGALPAVAKQELDGCPFDLERHSQLIATLEAQCQQAREALAAVLGEVNPSSGPQLSNWLQANLEPELLHRWPR
jgi:DNA polymerase-1